MFTIVLVMLEGVSPQDLTAKQRTSSLARLSVDAAYMVLVELELIASRLMLDRKHEREHRSDSA